MPRARWAVALLLAWTPALPAQDGRLEQAREAITAPQSAASSGGDKSTYQDDNGAGDLAGLVFFGIVAAPFYLPYVALGDSFDAYESWAQFPRHPYPINYRGYLWFERDRPEGASPDAPLPPGPPGLRAWAVRLSVEDGDDFHGVNRLGGRLEIDTSPRFGLRANWNYFHENLAGGQTDEAVTGDANLTFRFAQGERAQFFAGLGGRWWNDDKITRGGFNFTYGADFFPSRPLVLSSVLDAGTLGSAGVFHIRATAGVVWHHWEAFTGYDFLRIGSVNLQGPVAGIRLWF